jgi:hypothetical protein
MGGAINFKRTPTAVDYLSAGESLIAVTDTVTLPPRAITLSDADKADGRFIWIKDESGGAGVGGQNIVITPQTGTIDGAPSVSISVAFGKSLVYSDTANWFTL